MNLMNMSDILMDAKATTWENITEHKMRRQKES